MSFPIRELKPNPSIEAETEVFTQKMHLLINIDPCLQSNKCQELTNTQQLVDSYSKQDEQI